MRRKQVWGIFSSTSSQKSRPVKCLDWTWLSIMCTLVLGNYWYMRMYLYFAYSTQMGIEWMKNLLSFKCITLPFCTLHQFNVMLA